MAKLERPLFADQAHGNICRSISYVRSKGWPSCRHLYHRRKTRTATQALQRSRFFAAKEAWHALTEGDKRNWNNYATPPLNGYNTFLKFYLTGETPLTFKHYLYPALSHPRLIDLTAHYFQLTINISLYEKEDVMPTLLQSPDFFTVQHHFPDVGKLSPPDTQVTTYQVTHYTPPQPTITISLTEV